MKKSSLKSNLGSNYTTLDEWISNEAIPFSFDSSEAINAAMDRLLASMGNSVKLLGFGEALHGSSDILFLRNRLFQRLVEEHRFRAIAIESSFPRGRLINGYIAGLGPASYDEIQESGFSHGFGRLDANRELVEWMRAYNADPSHSVKLHFWGFDSPTEMMGSDSPGHILRFVLDYLDSNEISFSQEYRQRIDPLLGQDADWDNPGALIDPTKSIGRSANANALRVVTEDLIEELLVQRPELVARSGTASYQEAVQYAALARQLLNYHAALAHESDDRVSRLLGIRDAMMADILAYIVCREESRGKVLAFAHNRHLQRGRAEWRYGTDLYSWWPAGSHLDEILGAEYAVIGTAAGSSDAHRIGRPEEGSLEARLTAVLGPARFIPTYKGEGLPSPEIAALPLRAGSEKNPTYFPLSPESFTDFDWLAVVDSIA